jgi:hypothetical protein
MDLNGFLTSNSGLTQPAIWAAALVVLIILLRVSNIFRYIPNNQVGIVEKLWSAKGSVEGGFIALNGEAGYEPEVLRGGLHMLFPFMYRVHKSDLVTIGQGKIAYVFARDGAPLAASQVLAANDTEDKSDFEDARRFLLGGGQKGPQRKILREGTYAINTTQFAVITDERVYGHALSGQERPCSTACSSRLPSAGDLRRWCSRPVRTWSGSSLCTMVPRSRQVKSLRLRSAPIFAMTRPFTTISRSLKNS